MIGNDGRFVAALALASGLVASTFIAARTFERIKNENTISVTGSARRRIRSDLVVWSSTVSARSGSMGIGYRKLAGDVGRLTAYLEKKGIPRTAMTVSSIATRIEHPRDKDGNELPDIVSGYDMTESVEVRSADIDKIAAVAREVTELINEDVAVESGAPEYHYTKIGDLKIAMLAEAAKDARVRAGEVATSTGAKLGVLRSARMGVIQINPADSTETSNEGNNDTTSIDKDIITVVASTFSLE